MLKIVMQYVYFNAAVGTGANWIKDVIKAALSTHHPHELRYTFITRYKECECNPELVMLWDGHKFDKGVKTSVVDRGYTDYSNEYYFNKALRVDYEL